MSSPNARLYVGLYISKLSTKHHKMPANHFANTAYEKVSLHDEFDEGEFLKKTPIEEVDVNGNNTYKCGSHVSCSFCTFISISISKDII